ncbi:hypothetical protein ASE16_08215 [Leifsonia sp. Root227]|uniref:DUF4233 domain-containing protein n=1 Tax=Leifsonia sp. Root227 TaxID=1736496 RepID=UPI0006FCF5BD|nr:DUF4233 domain-containing protein [Leifsonia sp. Root227]KRC50931.1 hypothetical protein ASE16_08215 [Leifsonia sp. Root227]
MSGAQQDGADGPAADKAAAPARRPRRERTVREMLGSIVLGFELLVVFLGALVLFGLGSLPAAVALGGGAVVVVLMIVAMGTLQSPVGIVLGWFVQLVVVAAGFLVPAFFIVGAIFTAMWAYCMIAGARIDRNKKAANAAANGTENP